MVVPRQLGWQVYLEFGAEQSKTHTKYSSCLRGVRHTPRHSMLCHGTAAGVQLTSEFAPGCKLDAFKPLGPPRFTHDHAGEMEATIAPRAVVMRMQTMGSGVGGAKATAMRVTKAAEGLCASACGSMAS